VKGLRLTSSSNSTSGEKHREEDEEKGFQDVLSHARNEAREKVTPISFHGLFSNTH
jgi:hypothetical protein